MTQPPAERPLVLVVDDEPANLSAMNAVLRRHLRVQTASSGLEALRLAAQQPPDVVLMDVDLPEMNGYEICRRFKQVPGCAEVPVIFVTGLRSVEAERQGFDAGGVDYVHKPVSPPILLARLQTQLSLQRALADARAHEAQAQQLLDVLMPPVISRELRETGTVAPRVREGVAVLFADLVGFTRWCNQNSAADVVDGLQETISLLEDVAERHGVEKLKTIGDAFMGAAGLMNDEERALERAVACGREMAHEIDAMDNHWRLRVGVQRGPVVAGIIGRQRFRFDIWGDTVNLASRLCDVAQPGTVCVPQAILPQLDATPAPHLERVHVEGVGDLAVAHLPGGGPA